MNRRYMLCSCCALAITAVAHAKPDGAYWVEVPVVDDPGDATDMTGQRSFDLFVRLQPDDGVFAMDSGLAASNTGIALGPGQDFFQHAFGADKALDPGLNAVFPDLVYDSRFQMGTAIHDEYSVLFAPDWNTAGMHGSFFMSIVDGMGVPALPTADGSFWFGRFTVNSAGAFGEDTSGLGEYMGGQIFLSGTGSDGDFGMDFPIDGRVDVPNAFAIPSPAGAALLAALPAMRIGRRRRA